MEMTRRRVISISKKGESRDIKPDLFENEQEKKLFDAYEKTKDSVAESFASKNYEQALAVLSGLKEPIEDYFNHTMVNADDDFFISVKQLFLLFIFKQIRLDIAALAFFADGDNPAE